MDITAEIISIGTEILLGEIVDTNTQYIARSFRDAGIALYRTTSIGDNTERISAVIKEALSRCQVLITTGGLGPTVDDPTRKAVADALGVNLIYHPELWQQIQSRFKRFNRQASENNKKQAYIPEGAIPVENPVGTAPAFIFEIKDKTIISLPGVPREMEYLLQQKILPYLKQKYQLSNLIKTRILHTIGAGESHIDHLIGDLETLSNPTVGLAAHSGQVDIRITARASSIDEVNKMIAPVEHSLRERVGEFIYGADDDSLESIALRPILEKNWTLVVVEAGLEGMLVKRLARSTTRLIAGEVWNSPPESQIFAQLAEDYRHSHNAAVVIGAAIYPKAQKSDVLLVWESPLEKGSKTISYGGPPEYTPVWTYHHSLDILRGL